MARQETVGALRTDSETADKLRRAQRASGLSMNQFLNSLVRNALDSPTALVASITTEKVRVLIDPRYDR